MAQESKRKDRSQEACSYTVGLYKAEDANRAFQIEKASFMDPWPLTAFHEVNVDQGVTKGFACHSQTGKLLGYLIFYDVVDECHILNVAVDPKERKKGIATALLNRLEEEMALRKVATIFLEVRSQNEKAQTLYRRFGYQMIGKRKEYYQNDHDDALVLMKRL
jgi:ribosomal-protein-alanine N-acetyltransferase